MAMVLMGIMYGCMVFSLAELSSVLPTAGGGYGFARRALGPWGGFLTGTAILIEYVLAPAAISIFIGDYVESSASSASPPAGRSTCSASSSSSASTSGASARRCGSASSSPASP
ncbi:amino acid permease [Actinomadura keratinilytica]